MRTRLASLLLMMSLFICSAGFGQDMINQSRKLKHPTFLKEHKVDLLKNIPANSKFTIVGVEGEYYKVYFWNWNSNYEEIEEKKDEIKKTDSNKSDKLKKLNSELEKFKIEKDKYEKYNVNIATNEYRYFLIPINEIDRVSVEIFNKVSPSIGALSFPFKYRFNDRSFEPSFNMNLVGGIRFNPWDTNTHTFSILGGIGASSVKITSENTSETANVESEIDVAAVSFSLNFVYQFAPLQIGVSYGVDNIFNDKLYDWKHQGKPWLSVAIGIDVFKNSKPAKPTNN